jgi:hypothetical protein
MAAGIIDHECGTRDMRRINGMFRVMPRTAVLGMVAAGAMAGVPLLNGFLSKEMFFAEAVEQGALGGYAYVLPAFATFAGVLSVAYSIRFVHDVFFNGEPVNLPAVPHEPPGWMRLPVGILAALCLVVGLVPQLASGRCSGRPRPPRSAGPPPEYKLVIWHGFNLPLVMSIVAMAAASPGTCSAACCSTCMTATRRTSPAPPPSSACSMPRSPAPARRWRWPIRAACAATRSTCSAAAGALGLAGFLGAGRRRCGAACPGPGRSGGAWRAARAALRRRRLRRAAPPAPRSRSPSPASSG